MALKPIEVVVIVENGIVEDIYTNAKYPIEYRIIELDSQNEADAQRASDDHDELIHNDKYHSIMYGS